MKGGLTMLLTVVVVHHQIENTHIHCTASDLNNSVAVKEWCKIYFDTWEMTHDL